MKKKIILFTFILTSVFSLNAQEKLYKNAFPLSDVKLLDGPFKHACELNLQVLLRYDVDRFTGFRQAGRNMMKFFKNARKKKIEN